ncbi:MAG: hypothetical protein E7612_08040 [Ruminococcaceae bacterium]|nr:hypothetical protein [Oscillospiraceae bacterium]
MKLTDLTLREKVYRTVILNVKRMRGSGTIQDLFDKYPIGGLYYAKGPAEGLIEAVPGDTSTRADFVEKCKCASKYPLLVCADGATIENGPKPAYSCLLGATNSEKHAYDYGKSLGMQMNYNKVDWILGPCVDLPLFRCTETISGTMSDDPVYASKMYAQVVKGIQSQKVAATVKHFPGIGTHHVNMHISAGQNVLDFDKWMETYGYVYKEMFKAGVMSVMTSHITLRSFSEKADYGTIPIATHSKDLTIGLLKEKLGFEGVVVTDALTMGGCTVGSQVEEAVAAFACGADILLWPPVEAGDRIVEEIEAGRIPMSRLDDAIERIQRLYDKLGITLEEKDRERMPADPDFVEKTFKEINEKGITLIRDELGNLPLNKNRSKVLIDLIASESKKNDADEKIEGAEIIADMLKKEGFSVDIKWNYVNFIDKSLNEELKPYDYVIIMLDAPISIGATRDCFNSAWTVHLIPDEKKVFLNFASPYFIDDYYPEEKTFVHIGAPISPDRARAAANAILGKSKMTGKLMQTNIKV